MPSYASRGRSSIGPKIVLRKRVLTSKPTRNVHAGRVHLLQSAVVVQVLCETLQRIFRTAICSAHKSGERHCKTTVMVVVLNGIVCDQPD